MHNKSKNRYGDPEKILFANGCKMVDIKIIQKEKGNFISCK